MNMILSGVAALIVIAIIIVIVVFATKSSTKKGRYVKISQPEKGCMNISDLQVEVGNVNVAKGKSVTMSSQHASYSGDLLVDENFGNFAHTSCEEAGWMLLDLGSEMEIQKIIIKNRVDCCNGRIIGATVSILAEDKTTATFTSDAITGTAGETTRSDGMNAFNTYTITPPATAVVGS